MNNTTRGTEDSVTVVDFTILLLAVYLAIVAK